MTTRRELAEAHAFERRRLVNAFQGSDSGGFQSERTRPGRVVAASIGLGLLLIAGAAVKGVLVGHPAAVVRSASAAPQPAGRATTTDAREGPCRLVAARRTT